MIHPTIEILGQDVRVLVEQTTAIDPQRLGDFAGRLDPDELMEINVALRAVLDLEHQPLAAAKEHAKTGRPQPTCERSTQPGDQNWRRRPEQLTVR
jgi:hypothetical protein